MRFTIRILLAVLPLAMCASNAAAAPAAATGDWLTEAGDTRVRIATCLGHAEALCGRIVWLGTPDAAIRTDSANPDPRLRTRKVVGITILSAFVPSGPGHWVGGTIYNSKTGKSYAAKMTANPDGTLKVEGCVMMFCRAQIWRRG